MLSIYLYELKNKVELVGARPTRDRDSGPCWLLRVHVSRARTTVSRCVTVSNDCTKSPHAPAATNLKRPGRREQ